MLDAGWPWGDTPTTGTPRVASGWSDEELARRLDAVRDALLHFLRERHRLGSFKQKIRWRMSRRFIWPGKPEEREALLREAVEDDASVDAFRDYLAGQQRTITDAIERYNLAVRRNMEETLGRRMGQLDAEELEELRRRRITFQGVRDELRRRAGQLEEMSGLDALPELLSLRLAILTEDARDEILGEVGAFIADRAADADPEMSREDRDLIAMRTELWLRCLDQYHVARLLAKNYAEARRLMGFDSLMKRLRQLATDGPDSPGADQNRRRKIEILRSVLRKYLTFLEEIFPASRGTHSRESAVLREMIADSEPAGAT
jgi:hypothetical protein